MIKIIIGLICVMIANILLGSSIAKLRNDWNFKKFSKKLIKHDLIDSFNDEDYVEINTKLMLLRKYAVYSENVSIKKILSLMFDKYPDEKEKLNKLLIDYENVEKQNIQFVLSDGTKRSLYETIEDVMYGVYLHADFDKIKRLISSDENLRFTCVRKYVEDFETIILKTYDILIKYYDFNNKYNFNERASIIYLGDSLNNTQSITNSKYWSNLYGKDCSMEDLESIINDSEYEDIQILYICYQFITNIKETNLNISFLDNLIYPSTKKDWGNFLEAKSFYESINNPGLSTKVRYNKKHDMAYVRIMPNVDGAFSISTPHIIPENYEISLVKYGNNWKIYSFGSHLD